MALPSDPLIAAYNAILGILEADADFAPLYRAANLIKDTQPGWLANHLVGGDLSRFPKLLFAFGDYTDKPFTDSSFANERANFLAACADDWIEEVQQTYVATFLYDVKKHDSAYQHNYERAFITALRRTGPKLTSSNPAVLAAPGVKSWTVSLKRNPRGVDEQKMIRPINKLTLPITFNFLGRSLI